MWKTKSRSSICSGFLPLQLRIRLDFSESLHHTLADCMCFVRDVAAVFWYAPRVHVPDLQFPAYRNPLLQKTPNHAGDLRHNRLAAGSRDGLSGRDQLANLHQGLHVPVCRSAQKPLRRAAAYVARNAGIGDCASFEDGTAKAFSALGLDDGVAVLSGGKARSEGDHHRGLPPVCADIPFGHDTVHKNIRLVFLPHGRIFIDKDSNFASGECFSCSGEVPDEDSLHAVHFGGAFVYRSRKGHEAPHGEGHGDFGHEDIMTLLMEFPGDAGSEVPGTFDQNANGRSLLWPDKTAGLFHSLHNLVHVGCRAYSQLVGNIIEVHAGTAGPDGDSGGFKCLEILQ